MECKNCHTDLTSGSDYCHVCGAQVIRNRLTLKNLFRHLIETFFSYDNKLLQTMVYLFKDPEDVIDSYVNGVRKKYIAPLAFFAIAITISGIYLFILKKYYPEFFAFAESLYADEFSKEIGNKLTQFTTEFNSIIYFLFIPILALLSRIVFFNNKYNFTEHLVIYFYTLSLFSLFSLLVNLILLLFFPLNFLAVNLIIYVMFFLYQCYVLKQVFELSYKKLLIKILLFLPLLFVLYIVVTILVIIIFILTGIIDIEQFVPEN